MPLQKRKALATAVAAATCMLSLNAPSWADEPAAAPPKLEKLWQTQGFANPESALPIAAMGVIYVSNVNGAPDGKDGNGFISKVGLDGKIIVREWATGMNAPKGLGIAGDKLYAADIDMLREIDVKDGKVVKSYPAKDAKFLNDIAVDASGNVYVSDMVTNIIWRLSGGVFEPWLANAALDNPNGLAVEGDDLRVAAWGVMTDGFATKVPGHLKSVSLATKAISDVGDARAFGNLDGLVALGNGRYLISDWMKGTVMSFSAAGKVATLLDLGQGSADIGYDPASKTLYVPHMMKGELIAYRVE